MIICGMVFDKPIFGTTDTCGENITQPGHQANEMQGDTFEEIKRIVRPRHLAEKRCGRQTQRNQSIRDKILQNHLAFTGNLFGETSHDTR